jgi:hypothetical protein
LKPVAHLTASAVVSTLIYAATRSMPVTVVSFFSGFLLDIDHFIDYIREYGLRVSRKEFFRVYYETRFEKLLLLFHAWELVPGLLLLAWLSGWNEVMLGLLAGIFHHMVLDQVGNGFTARGYFFIYRAAKRFSMKAIVREAALIRRREK